VLILVVNELLPWLFLKVLKLVIDLRSQFQLKSFSVIKDIRSPQDLCDFDELIVVIGPFEERLSLENHAGQHAPCTPDV
jgi:hypothetical protein